MLKIIIDEIHNLFKIGLENMLNENQNLLSTKFGKESDLLSVNHEGLSLTGTKHLSIEKSKQHVLYFGPTGSGKTTISLIGSAINIGSAKTSSSMIINNPSGENQRLEPFLISRGYTVLNLNPNDIRNSIYYNPLSRIKSSDIQKVAMLLVAKGNKKPKDFWDIKSIELISLLIEFLLDNAPKIYQNIANVYYLLQNLAGDENTINSLFADKATDKQWRAYKSIIANSDNTKASIISSAISSLSFIGNSPELSDITSIDSFDFSRLKSEKICLFLNIKTMDMQFYSPILGLFFEQLFYSLMEEIPKKEDYPLYFMIDELSSIPLPSLPIFIANARKYFSILAILQSENQLKENYGEYDSKTILNNACKVYMSGLDAECERISTALGDYQYYEEGEGKVLRTRRLMTAQEIRTMPRDRVIILPSGGSLPLYCKVTPYYKNRKYLKYMEMKLPIREESELDLKYTAQYLSLNKYKIEKNGKE